MKEYSFKKGSRITGIDPEEAGAIFAAKGIKDDGFIERETVLKEAEKKSSPLHDYFEWDDSVAANEHRLSQAGHLIRCLVVQVVNNHRLKEPVRAYEPVIRREAEDNTKVSYMSIEDIFKDPEYHAQILERAKRELADFARKYKALKELDEVFAVIEKVMQAA